MKNNVKVALLLAIASSAIAHCMHNTLIEQAHATRTWNADELSQFASEQKAKEHSDQNKNDFGKTLNLLDLLPKVLQREVHDWNTEFTCLRTLRGHAGAIRSLALYQDDTGWKAASGSTDGTLKIWDLKKSKLLYTLTGHKGFVDKIALFQDDAGWKGVSNAGGDNNIVRLWDLTTGQQLHTFASNLDDCITDLITYKDQKSEKLAVITKKGNVLVWNLSAYAYSQGCATPGSRFVEGLNLWKPQIQTSSGKLQTPRHAVTFADNTQLMAITASTDGTLQVWDLATNKELRELPGPKELINSLAIYEDGTSLKAISGSDNILRVWDLGKGKQLLTLVGPEKCRSSKIIVHQDKDGTKAICAWHKIQTGGNNSIQIWDLVTGKCLNTLTGHTDTIYYLAAYNDASGLKIVSGSNDGTLRLWGHGSGSEEQEIAKTRKIVQKRSQH